MRVVICDDHQLFGEALAVVLRRNGFDVAAVTTTTAEAEEAATAPGVDVCVMDVNFPDGPAGLAAARRIKARSPSTAVLMLTSSSDPDVFGAALSAGAHAVLYKMQPIADIVSAVSRLPAGYTGAPRPWRTPASRPAMGLTPREIEVLQLLVNGEGTDAIAQRLGVGHATTRGHIQSIFLKLSVHSRIEAVAYAVRHGMATSPSAVPRE